MDTVKKFDVVVVGGGLAGVCSAIAAAQEGCQTVLITDRDVLGGNSSSECGVPPHGAESMGYNRNCRDTGLLEEMRLEYYLKWSPHSDSRAYWDLILYERCKREKNLKLMLNTRVNGCRVHRGVIQAVTAVSPLEKNLQIEAPVFIDDTGDGYLASEAGADFRWGREARSEFDEHRLAKDTADEKTLGCTIYGWALKREYPVSYSAPDWAVSYDSCNALAHRSHNVDYLFPTVAASKDHNTLQIFWWLEWGGQLDVIAERDAIYHHLLAQLLGVWDHLKNSCDDKTRKALENFELVRWSRFPMRRESRRVVGDYMITEGDLFQPKLFEDRIGFGGWPPDDHPPEGIHSTDPPCDQVFLYEPYSIPYRSLYSKDIENLFLGGRCLSASHVALSSIRVMNTLGSLGEALGVAAAMCVQRDCSPREVYRNFLSELQQKVLDRDLYIIAMPNQNKLDLALQASVRESSMLPLACKDAISFIELKYDTVLQFPVSENYLSRIRVFLKAERPSSIDWELFVSEGIGTVPDNCVQKGSMSVAAGESWHEILDGAAIPVEAKQIVSLVLKANKNIRWGYSEELFHTRWGISYGKLRSASKYHGKASMAPTDSPWLSINHNGRIPDDVAQWLDGKPGIKNHSKLFVTPMFETIPVQYPYAGENTINGYNRAERSPNMWISKEGMPQSLLLEWDSPIRARRIELLFDTQLDHADQMYGFPRSGTNEAIPEIIPETVKNYRLEYFGGGKWLVWASVDNNIYRRRIHESAEPVETDKIRLIVEQTWGAESARVYGVRVW